MLPKTPPPAIGVFEWQRLATWCELGAFSIVQGCVWSAELLDLFGCPGSSGLVGDVAESFRGVYISRSVGPPFELLITRGFRGCFGRGCFCWS